MHNIFIIFDRPSFDDLASLERSERHLRLADHRRTVLETIAEVFRDREKELIVEKAATFSGVGAQATDRAIETLGTIPGVREINVAR